jgi:hypothetical protein
VSLAIFPTTPPAIHPYGYEDDDAALIVKMAGSALEQRSSLYGRKLRTYHLRYRTTASNRATLDAFFLARRFTAESFLYRDLKDYARTGVAVVPATSDGIVTAFALPTSGVYAGDYPIDDAHAILYRAGVSVGTITVQTDARTLTRSPAPSAGGAMTADYWYYRRVRLLDRFAWAEPVYGTFEADFALVEVGAT